MSEGIKALEVILKDRITNNSLDKNIEEVIIIVKELLKLQEYRDYEKELGITFKDIYLARKGKKAKHYLIHFSNGDKKLCYAFDEKEARTLAENIYRDLEIEEIEIDESNKSLLIAIKPKWCAKIMNGEKTIEVRKNKALANAIKKLIDENGHADIYVYCSKDKKYANLVNRGGFITGMVAFKFRCYKVEEITPKVKAGLLHTYNTYETKTLVINPLLDQCCLSYEELDLYLKWKVGYAIHISDLEIFDKPKELNEYKKYYRSKGYPQSQNWYLTKAPQHFCYVEVEE